MLLRSAILVFALIGVCGCAGNTPKQNISQADAVVGDKGNAEGKVPVATNSKVVIIGEKGENEGEVLVDVDGSGTDKMKLRCRKIKPIGSNIPVKVCQSEEDLERSREHAKQALNDAGRRAAQANMEGN
jgi:hypothetical protein